jgi:hypothetical protein
VWAAAAVPMGILAGVVAPWRRDQLGGEDPFVEALLICITAGLIWQFVLVLILVGRELGGVQWSRLREALWMRAPRDPKTGRWAERSGGGRSCSSFSSRSGRPYQRSRRLSPEISPISLTPTVARTSSAARGAGSRSSSSLSCSTPCSARSCSSGAAAAANASRLREGRLGRQRGAVHRLSPARAVGHADHPGGGHLH